MANGPQDAPHIGVAATAANDDTTPADGQPATPAPARLPAGTVVAKRYRVVRYLARGGMGEVYEAEDLELQERVALKTVRADIQDPANEERFKREIQLSRKVTHPSVCRIFDVGYDVIADGTRLVFLTMELVIGETLLERVRREGPLPMEVADLITRQIVGALGAAHAAGVVHRDLKSGNVLLGVRKDGSVRVAVADFGLAYGITGASDRERSLSGSGGVVGTPGYMAPEQLEGGELSARTDVYALGVVMFEMATGKLPFEGPTPLAIATKRLTTPPPSARKLRHDLPIQWERTILACMERDPARRPPRARDVLAFLDEPAVTSVHFERLRRRAPIVRPLLALLLFAVAAALAYRAGHGGGRTLGAQMLSRGIDFGTFAPHSSEVLPGYGLCLRNALRTDLGFELPVVQSRIEIDAPDGHGVVIGYARPRERGREPLRIEGSFELSGEATDRRIEVTMRVVDPSTNEQLAQVVESSPSTDLEDLVLHLGDRLRAVAHLTPTPRQALSPRGRTALAEANTALHRYELASALEITERALADERGSAELRYMLGRVLGAMELDVAASSAMERAAALHPDDPDLRQRILAAGNWRDPARAAHTLEQLHVAHPADDDLTLDLVHVLTRAQRTSDARSTLAELAARAHTPLDRLRADLAGMVIARRQDRTADAVSAYPPLLAAARAANLPGAEVAVLEQACGIESWRDATVNAVRVCGELARAGERERVPSAVVAGPIFALGSRVSTETRPEYRAEALRTMQLAWQLGGRTLSAEALTVDAIVNLDLGTAGTDTSLMRAALQFARAAHDQATVVATLFNLAYYADQAGQLALSMSYLRQVIELSIDNGAPLYRYDALCRLGLNQLDIGDVAGARRALDEAQRSTNVKPDETDTDCPMLSAYIAYEENRPDDAVARLAAIARINFEGGDLAAAHKFDWTSCRAYYDLGRFAEVLTCADRYDARLIEDGAPISRLAKVTRAATLGQLGRLREARAVAQSVGWPKTKPGDDSNNDELMGLTLDRTLGVPATSIGPRLDALITKEQTGDYKAAALRARIERGLLELREHHAAAALNEVTAVRDEARRDGLLTIASRATQIVEHGH